MTRKKFVKQLMARGYQRNAAETMALYARGCGYSYEQYMEIETKYDGLHYAVDRLRTAIVECIGPVCEAAGKVMNNLRATLAGIDLASCLDMHRGGGGND